MSDNLNTDKEMMREGQMPLVSIQCLVYNHEPFLRKCLEGFVMQKTTFPFEAIVHDDCSTDGSAAIIREYAEKYPHIIKPVFQKVNLSTKPNASYERLKAIWEPCRGKYIAMCEGDDYWTDPDKLQTQVSFLESHPEYTMTCNQALLFSEKRQTYCGIQGCYEETRDIAPEDAISKGGLFIPTCSLVYRREMRELEYYPDYCKNCHVGDYPLQIMCVMKGKAYYFDKAMSVYRVENSKSWVGKESAQILDEKFIKNYRSEVEMLNGFAVDFPQFKSVLNARAVEFLISILHGHLDWSVKDRKRLLSFFQTNIRKAPLKQRLTLYSFSIYPNIFARLFLKIRYLFFN